LLGIISDFETILCVQFFGAWWRPCRASRMVFCCTGASVTW